MSAGRDNLFGVIPGYREAVLREAECRREAFLDMTEEISGVEVRPLTLRHALILESVGSPFLCGGPVAPADVVIFLWVVSPAYSADAKACARFVARCRKLPFDGTCRAIRAYLEDSLADSPTHGQPATDSCAAWPASFVDTFAREYGWSDEVVLGLPFKRAFQYLRCIVKRYDSRKTFFDRSDSVRGEWLQSQNAQGTSAT